MRELCERMDAREFADWQTYYALEPWDLPARALLQFGESKGDEPPEQTPEQLERIFDKGLLGRS